MGAGRGAGGQRLEPGSPWDTGCGSLEQAPGRSPSVLPSPGHHPGGRRKARLEPGPEKGVGAAPVTAQLHQPEFWRKGMHLYPLSR